MLNPTQKIVLLADYVARYELRNAVETGLYAGHGSLMELNGLNKRYLLDLDRDQCRRAKDLCPDATIVLGDSRWTLPTVVRSLDGPTLFWLDAHLIEGDDPDHPYWPCPLLDELAAIPNGQGHVILIDDLRLMGHHGWPSIGTLRNAITDWPCVEADDIMRLVPSP